jgi:hypothetical protein
MKIGEMLRPGGGVYMHAFIVDVNRLGERARQSAPAVALSRLRGRHTSALANGREARRSLRPMTGGNTGA